MRRMRSFTVSGSGAGAVLVAAYTQATGLISQASASLPATMAA